MEVNPGELNKRIVIFQVVPDGEDDEGYPLGTEEKVIRKCWAKFSRTGGTEAVKSGSEMESLKCRFLVRYSKKEIDESMQIRYAGKIFNIKYVNDYGDSHEYIEIWCERNE